MNLAQALKISVTPEPKGTHRDLLVKVLRRFRELEDGTITEWETTTNVRYFKNALSMGEDRKAIIGTNLKSVTMANRWIEYSVYGSSSTHIFNGTAPFIASFLRPEEIDLLRAVMEKLYPIKQTCQSWPIANDDPRIKMFEAEVKRGQWPFTIVRISANGLVLMPEIVGIEVRETERDMMVLKTILFDEKPKIIDTVDFGVERKLYQDTGVLQTEIFGSGAYSLRFTRESEASFVYTVRFEGEMARLPPVDEIMAGCK